MADFCRQCGEELGLDCDLDGLTTPEDWARGYARVVLCEDCGVIQVDPNGNCVTDCDKHHAAPRRP
jgi:hypothetical protein